MNQEELARIERRLHEAGYAQTPGRFQAYKKSEPQFGMIAVTKPATTKRGSDGSYHTQQ